METIKMISVDKIYPHPKNPRDDVGDVTELAESIRSQGIMQNLTVIKGKFMTKDEYVQTKVNRGVDKRAAEHGYGWRPWEEKFNEHIDAYTVIIGHRRLAAARLAGLQEVPCTVAELDPSEQVAVMLSENMQRADLTVTEQAYGCQLMFDLGSSAGEIADRTGLNKSTVYHRLNLAKLDRDLLKEKERDEAWQFSIKDFYVLEQIEDIGKRNELLKKATSSNGLRYLAEQAAKAQKRDAAMERLARIFERHGIAHSDEYEKDPYNAKFRQVANFNLDREYGDDFDPGIDASGGGYVWRHHRYAGLAMVAREAEPQEEPEEKKESEYAIRQKKNRQIAEIAAGMREKMRSIIADIITEGLEPEGGRTGADEAETLWAALVRMNAGIYISELEEEWSKMNPEYDGEKDAEDPDYIRDEFMKLSMLQQMWVAMAHHAVRRQSPAYWDGKYRKEEGSRYCFLCRFLEPYGFMPDGDERAVIDGTHELYEEE